jgi:hypothetical protein
MKGDALRKVSLALKQRLDAALAQANIAGTVFVGSLDDTNMGNAPLGLFLYRISPNPDLRNREHRVAAAGATPNQPAIVFRNALPVDLHFLLTVGKNAVIAEETLLYALGVAMQTLQSEPELSGPQVEFETIRISFESLTTEESSRIWALFPQANYRTSVAYLASPVWIDPLQVRPEGAPVLEDALFAGQIGVGDTR